MLPPAPNLHVVARSSPRSRLETNLRAAAACGNGDPIPRYLALNISSAGGTRGGRLDALLREVEMLAQLFDRDRDVLRLRWLMDSFDTTELAAVDEVFNALSRQFHLADPQRSEFWAQVPAGLGNAVLDQFSTLGFTAIDWDLCGQPIEQWPTSAVDLATRSAARFRQFAVSMPLSQPPIADQQAALLAVRAGLAPPEDWRSLGEHCWSPHRHPLWHARQSGSLGCDVIGYSIGLDCDVLALGPGCAAHVGSLRYRNEAQWPTYLGAINEGALPLCPWTDAAEPQPALSPPHVERLMLSSAAYLAVPAGRG